MAIVEKVVVHSYDDGRRAGSREVPIAELGLLAGAKVLAISGAALTLTNDHHGKILDLYHTSTITVTVPNDLRADFFCGISQATVNQITVQPGAGADVKAYNNQLKTAGQYAMASLIAMGEDLFRLYGQTSA